MNINYLDLLPIDLVKHIHSFLAPENGAAFTEAYKRLYKELKTQKITSIFNEYASLKFKNEIEFKYFKSICISNSNYYNRSILKHYFKTVFSNLEFRQYSRDDCELTFHNVNACSNGKRICFSSLSRGDLSVFWSSQNEIINLATQFFYNTKNLLSDNVSNPFQPNFPLCNNENEKTDFQGINLCLSCKKTVYTINNIVIKKKYNFHYNYFASFKKRSFSAWSAYEPSFNERIYHPEFNSIDLYIYLQFISYIKYFSSLNFSFIKSLSNLEDKTVKSMEFVTDNRGVIKKIKSENDNKNLFSLKIETIVNNNLTLNALTWNFSHPSNIFPLAVLSKTINSYSKYLGLNVKDTCQSDNETRIFVLK